MEWNGLERQKECQPARERDIRVYRWMPVQYSSLPQTLNRWCEFPGTGTIEEERSIEWWWSDGGRRLAGLGSALPLMLLWRERRPTGCTGMLMMMMMIDWLTCQDGMDWTCLCCCDLRDAVLWTLNRYNTKVCENCAWWSDIIIIRCKLLTLFGQSAAAADTPIDSWRSH